jgi:hypothetical protein
MRGKIPYRSSLLSPHTPNDQPKAAEAHSSAASSSAEPIRSRFIMRSLAKFGEGNHYTNEMYAAEAASKARRLWVRDAAGGSNEERFPAEPGFGKRRDPAVPAIRSERTE